MIQATDRLFTVVFWIAALFYILGYPVLNRPRRGARRVSWIQAGILLFGMLSLGVSVYLWTWPHGLSAQYYDNAQWLRSSVELDRYFEADGQGRRVDRFVDFNPNDFNPLTSIGAKPFSIVWQGYVNIPADHTILNVNSNFGTWLYVDDQLTAGHHRLNFGTSEARTFLREGWSHNEQWQNNPNLSFVWSDQPSSEFYLGVDEVADYVFLLRCRPFPDPSGRPQTVTVSIQGTSIGTIALQDGWQTYSLTAPASVFRAPGFFKVKLTYAYTVRPADVLPQSPETRTLAVAADFAELRKMAVSPDASQPTPLPDQFASTAWTRGLHRVTLKATSDGRDPYLRLTWQRLQDKHARVIMEDHLFPAHLSREAIQHTIPRERLILWMSIGLKGLGLLLLGALFVKDVLPWYVIRLTWRDALIFLAIAAAAFVLRVIFLIEMKQHEPTFWVLEPGTDHLNYIFFARGFFRGYWPMLTHSPFYEGPLVSFYFIVCSILVGENLIALRMCTILLGLGSLGLVFLLTKRMFSMPVAVIAGVLYACNGVIIFYDICLLMEPQVVFLNLLALWLMLRFKERLQWRTTVGLGIVLGLTAMGRGMIALLMPIFFGWILLAAPTKITRKFIHLAGLCVVVLLTMLPVGIRNYFASTPHRIVFTTTNSAIVLWAANNPTANGMGHYSTELLAQMAQQVQATGSSLRAEVFRYMTEQPWHYLNLEYRKFKMFWAGYEIGNNISYYWMRSLSRLLQLPWVNFVLIAPLGVVGMLLSISAWRQRILLYGFVVIQLLAVLMFVVASRYRLPVVPALSIFAAHTIWCVIQHIRQRDWRRVVIVLAATVLLYGAMNYATAARYYELRHSASMPVARIARYWDVFDQD